MVLVAVLVGSRFLGAQLTLADGVASWVHDGKTDKVSYVPPAPKRADRVVFRKDETFVVWDARGLSVRHGKRVVTTRLPEISLTPKLFSKDEILATREKIAAGSRSQEASALSGAKRLGSDVYLLVRWDDKTGTPWLEALVRVNLEKKDSKPELVGKFDGISTARLPIDDRLMLSGDTLTTIVRTGATWGVARYAPQAEEFSMDVLGTGLVDYRLPKAGRIIALEQTSYSTSVVASVDLVNLTRRILLDSSGEVKLVDGEEPALAVVARARKRQLQNLESGIVLGLAPDESVVRAFGGVLIFRPADKPAEAKLLTLERFEPIAQWKKDAKPAPPAGRSAPPRTRREPPAPLPNHPRH